MKSQDKAVVNDRTVMMNFEIVLDERVLDIDAEGKLEEYSALLDPERAAELVEIEKESQFCRAIESKMKAGGVNLEFVGKDQDGEDVYRMT